MSKHLKLIKVLLLNPDFGDLTVNFDVDLPLVKVVCGNYLYIFAEYST